VRDPANVLIADEFLERFDGFSIGSNDLTQLTLGVDRDSSLVAASFDERNPAVKKLLPSHRRLQAQRQVRRHLRPGALGSPRPGGLADGPGHRLHVPQPGHGGLHLDAAGRPQTRLTGGIQGVGMLPMPWIIRASSASRRRGLLIR
jgi:hypothetical protein